MWDSQSPDNDPDLATQGLAYRGTLKNVNGTLINFFLPEDQATSFAWEINNDQTKPPYSEATLVSSFEYNRQGQPGQKLYKFHFDQYGGLAFDYSVTNKFEAMAFACRTWGKAAGAWERIEGAVNGGAVNMKSSIFGNPNGFDNEHSAEFNRHIQQLTPFYNALLDRLEVNRNNP